MEVLGMRCLENRDYEQALWFFEKKLNLDPNNKEIQRLIKTTKMKINPTLLPKQEAQTEVLARVLKEKNYYNILGCQDEHAKETEISKCYKHAALLLHPDKNSDPRALQAFTKLKKAFETLSNPLKRQVYDEHGEEGVNNVPEDLQMDDPEQREDNSKLKPTGKRRGRGPKRLSIVFGDGSGSVPSGAASPESMMSDSTSSLFRGQSFHMDSPSSRLAQAEKFEKQHMARTNKKYTHSHHTPFQVQKELTEARFAQYEPPRDLCRKWHRRQVMKENVAVQREETAKLRATVLDAQYQQLLNGLHRQRQQLKLSCSVDGVQ
eukprot:TRINITY_DN66769_c2_g2_i1.p1 TRINITY_DN66769_c2_g2~~TRINITY_DN66769_c2_g2_i1.p1  ORF type:complete len:320 (+),score=29.79 TRINITY_DN66769_c2_g2_i1:54-1013(+)